MDRWPVGSHGGTYGGNPMACAAALATLDIMTETEFLPRAAEVGARFRTGLDEIATRFRAIGENRNLGAMLASEIVDDEGCPDPARTAAIMRHLLVEEHVVVMSCGPYGSTLRWIPPLVISDEQIDHALASLDRALIATA